MHPRPLDPPPPFTDDLDAPLFIGAEGETAPPPDDAPADGLSPATSGRATTGGGDTT